MLLEGRAIYSAFGVQGVGSAERRGGWRRSLSRAGRGGRRFARSGALPAQAGPLSAQVFKRRASVDGTAGAGGACGYFSIARFATAGDHLVWRAAEVSDRSTML